MAKISGYQCECGKVKGEANRWLLGRIATHCTYEGAFLVSETDFVGIRAWDDEESGQEGVLHFCSDHCALSWQQKEIEEMGR